MKNLAESFSILPIDLKTKMDKDPYWFKGLLELYKKELDKKARERKNKSWLKSFMDSWIERNVIFR